jgi:hypothetical protein
MAISQHLLKRVGICLRTNIIADIVWNTYEFDRLTRLFSERAARNFTFLISAHICFYASANMTSTTVSVTFDRNDSVCRSFLDDYICHLC